MTTQTEFPSTGFVRLKQILAPIGPIPGRKSTWWAGASDGRFPKPVKLGKGTTVWRAEDIRALYEKTDQAKPASVNA
jgi:prophage regulatory protein